MGLVQDKGGNLMDPSRGEVWVFADYRDYDRNRVTLELIAKARELAERLCSRCAVAVLGWGIAPYVMEYIAHGAQAVYVMEAPQLSLFRSCIFTEALCHMIRTYRPEILLVGGTDFGREFAPRVAKRLKTGLSSDCVGLEIDEKTGLMLQTTPAFGGRLSAQVITPERRPQMATVRPGVFKERPHDQEAIAPVIYMEPVEFPQEQDVELLFEEVLQEDGISLEDAQVVLSAGLGVGNPDRFGLVSRLAGLLGGQVGGTRPLVNKGLLPEERMIGQTGHTVKPKILISLGTSGALQYTAGIQNSEFIIALDRNPDAPIFKHADLGIVGNLEEILPRLVRALEEICRKDEEVAHG
jgi:electron transfer flavoprotein alpha subunit